MNTNSLIVIDLDQVETIAELLPDFDAQTRLLIDLNAAPEDEHEEDERFDGMS